MPVKTPALGLRFLQAMTAVMMLTFAWGRGQTAEAQGLFSQPKYAAIVVDAANGEVLYTRRADAQRFPASITKLMTLYLTFEALSTGRLSPNDSVPFSRWATEQAPSKLGVREGQSITVNQAIQAAAVKSANDVAVALAEKLGGTEARFAQLMTLRAQELGMTGTRYVNASGLPDARQISTARDIAILSRAILRDYPQYYSYFGQRSFEFHGQSTLNHNRLLMKMPGVDGLKTGYTNAAGFNLAASAVRGGRRLIAVVLGGSSTAARDENVEDLLNAGFDVINRRGRGEHLTLAALLHAPVDEAEGMVTRPPTEMGSADQSGLKLVAGDPALAAAQARTAQWSHAVLEPQPISRAARLRTAEALSAPLRDCGRLRGRRHRAACRQENGRAVAAVDPCAGSRHHRRHAHAACAAAVTRVALTDCSHLHGRHARACRASLRTETAPLAASATPGCDKLRHGRHRRAGCTVNAASATAVAAAGRYIVQVGAFDSRREARKRLASLSSGKHGRLFKGGSADVEGAGGGYRARFSGLSRHEAQAACHRLAAQGQRCLVVAPT